MTFGFDLKTVERMFASHSEPSFEKTNGIKALILFPAKNLQRRSTTGRWLTVLFRHPGSQIPLSLDLFRPTQRYSSGNSTLSSSRAVS